MDAYQDGNFSDKHKTWKMAMNTTFSQLVRSYVKPKGCVVYLDAASGQTSTALQEWDVQRFVANNNATVVEALQKQHANINVVLGDMETCLQNDWKDVQFQAAWFDTCSESVETVIAMCAAFFDDRKFAKDATIVLGYTIYGRHKKGESQIKRVGEVERYLNETSKRLARNLLHVENATHFQQQRKLDKGVYTAFFLLQPNVTQQDALLAEAVATMKRLEDTVHRITQTPPPCKPVTYKPPSTERTHNERGICYGCGDNVAQQSTVCAKEACKLKKRRDENRRAMQKKRKLMGNISVQKHAKPSAQNIASFFRITK
jgi:hypothetical protein